MFSFSLQFFKIETTYKRKAKDLRKTWRNFTTLHKLVSLPINNMASTDLICLTLYSFEMLHGGLAREISYAILTA